MDGAIFIHLLQEQRLVTDYMFISAISTFVYDYILTLHLEIELIWFSQWSYTKVLFLVFRYMTFIEMALALHNQTFPNLSAGTCKATYPAQMWLMIFQAIIAEIILAIRTWAVWNRNKTVGILLVVSILASSALQFFLLNKFIQSLQYAPPLYQGSRGCSIVNADTTLWGNYAILTAIEAIFLVLMVTSAVRSFRESNRGRFSFIIHRDGIIFYVYLLFISAANMVVVLAIPPMMVLLAPFESALYAVFTTRIVFNIRALGDRSRDMELHAAYHEAQEAPWPLGPWRVGSLIFPGTGSSHSMRKSQGVDCFETSIVV